MNEPIFSKFPVRTSDDGKTAEIQCWFVDRPFTCEEILRQIHRVNPDANLSEVIFTPRIVFDITIPIKQVAETP